MSNCSKAAVRSLQLELKKIQEEPVEGFQVRLLDETNLFVWQVAIFGPPDTLYAGGYFKAIMKFPNDYPYSPPTVRFLTKMWHPNVYENGDVCISILHSPVDDPHSGELPSERWNPTQNVRTILLSIISLLNEPNTSSPANVDASVSFRRWKESKDEEYEKIVRKQVCETQEEAKRDGVTVPTNLKEYCGTSKPLPRQQSYDFCCDDIDNLYEDEEYDDDDDDEDDDSDEDEEDSGHGDV